MKFHRFDLQQGASVSPGEQINTTACFWLPGGKLTNKREQNLFVPIPLEATSPVSRGPAEMCEEPKESGNMRRPQCSPSFKNQFIQPASDHQQPFRAAIKAVLNVCGGASLSGSTLLDIQLASRTS